MTYDQIKIQQELAQLAGQHPEGAGITWAGKYNYHLGAVENPLPFEIFKRRERLLDSLLKEDPEGKRVSLDSQIDRLCKDLGC